MCVSFLQAQFQLGDQPGEGSEESRWLVVMASLKVFNNASLVF